MTSVRAGERNAEAIAERKMGAVAIVSLPSTRRSTLSPIGRDVIRSADGLLVPTSLAIPDSIIASLLDDRKM